jgi:hypothetical protein
MGLFRYLVQGFGWELGATAAREGIKTVAEQESPNPILDHAPPTARELEAARKEARREAARKQVEAERKQAEIEAELQRLKKSR